MLRGFVTEEAFWEEGGEGVEGDGEPSSMSPGRRRRRFPAAASPLRPGPRCRAGIRSRTLLRKSLPAFSHFFLDLRQLPNSCAAKSCLGLPGKPASSEYVPFLQRCYPAGDDAGMQLQPSRDVTPSLPGTPCPGCCPAVASPSPPPFYIPKHPTPDSLNLHLFTRNLPGGRGRKRAGLVRSRWDLRSRGLPALPHPATDKPHPFVSGRSFTFLYLFLFRCPSGRF